MVSRQDILVANKQIRFITNVGIIINIALAALKVIVGILGHSMALVADGIHSISDMITDLAVLIGIYFGTKEADRKHPYGHGRFETVATTVIAGVLVLVGLGMIYKAAANISELHIVKPSPVTLLIAITSIISKEWLYKATKRYAIKTHSSTVMANAWHHRSDALSSVAVVIGIGAVMLGFEYGDHLAAIAVGLMIALAGWRILIDCVQEFTERAVDKDTVQKITSIINANDSIKQWHKLRTRLVGREVFLDLHILVDPGLNIAEAHRIADSLEDSLHNQMVRPVNITVHIEPDLPELRK
ncbi:MAG: cation diffusion facilitator family transporter [Phycisphaerae bacterium]|nr:cation diffusion facilitator family transporter [Phycisphaerae bacterium]